MDDIYRKTDKGHEEIAKRAYRLPARVRSMLILVDGRRSTAQLLDQGRHFGDAEQFLRDLIEGGFIEPAGGLPHGEPHGEPALATVADAQMPAVRGFAQRFIADALGPDGDAIAVTIEQAREAAELNARLERVRDMLRELRGQQLAERFRQELQAAAHATPHPEPQESSDDAAAKSLRDFSSWAS